VRVHRFGEGVPEVAVVGAIHGDEPCGAAAVHRLREELDDGDVERSVSLILANERALDAGERYLETDLNRSFPGDPNADAHETRLAHDLAREIRGATVLALHSTRSYAGPFAVVDSVSEVARSVAPRLPIDALVETGENTDGRLIEYPHTVEVECGLQGSDAAAENAYWLARSFLSATGAVAPPTADSPLQDRTTDPVPVFRLEESIPKPDAEEYAVFAENFQRVAAEEAFAAADGEPLTAGEPFFPVLLSAEGYEDQFGFAADRVGVVGED